VVNSFLVLYGKHVGFDTLGDNIQQLRLYAHHFLLEVRWRGKGWK